MGKQTKPKATPSIGKGKVTPMQVAFIVDRYLSDNNFSDTRSAFRIEAASLISKSPVQEAPKSLLTLGAMLNEYISLKEQKVMVDQERARLDQEKFRVQTLLQGMQEAMNAYNVSGNGNAPTSMILNSASRSLPMVPQSCGSPAAGCTVYASSPTVMPVSMSSNVVNQHGNMSSSVQNLTRKRVGSIVGIEPPSISKKSRGKLPLIKKTPNQGITQETARSADNSSAKKETAQSSMIRLSPGGSLVQGSSVAKSLFNRPFSSSPTNSTGPTTPPQSISLHNDQSVSPVGISSAAHCSNNISTPQVTPTNCTVITSERVIVSPCKHVSYTMERNHCISSSSPVKTTFKRLTKRENVKGRLDFDGSDVATTSLDKPSVEELCTSESDKEGDIFDIDLPNLDAFGANFSFSELLIDLDLDCESIGCPCPPILGTSTETNSGSLHKSKEGNLGADPLTYEFSSAVAEEIPGKDMNIRGPDTLTAVTSITTKCIILSPAKTNRSALEQ